MKCKQMEIHLDEVPVDVLPWVQEGQQAIEAEKEAQRAEDERYQKIRQKQEQIFRYEFPKELQRFVHLSGALIAGSDYVELDLIIPGLSPIQVTLQFEDGRWSLNDQTRYILPDFMENDEDVFWVWDSDDCVVEKNLPRALATARELYELMEERRYDLQYAAQPEPEYVELEA